MFLAYENTKTPAETLDALRLELNQVEIALDGRTDLSDSMYQQLVRREKRLTNAIHRLGAKPAIAQY